MNCVTETEHRLFLHKLLSKLEIRISVMLSATNNNYLAEVSFIIGVIIQVGNIINLM